MFTKYECGGHKLKILIGTKGVDMFTEIISHMVGLLTTLQVS